jgi:hypothetical protein
MGGHFYWLWSASNRKKNISFVPCVGRWNWFQFGTGPTLEFAFKELGTGVLKCEELGLQPS